MTRINRDNKMQCFHKKILIRYSIKIVLYFLHPCANTQDGYDLLIESRKVTDQPVKIIGCLLSLVKECGRIIF